MFRVDVNADEMPMTTRSPACAVRDNPKNTPSVNRIGLGMVRLQAFIPVLLYAAISVAYLKIYNDLIQDFRLMVFSAQYYHDFRLKCTTWLKLFSLTLSGRERYHLPANTHAQKSAPFHPIVSNVGYMLTGH
jgi:hypothetical protein